METPLTTIEARVLGALVEKSLTTPEYYPLTLNSLTAACNQKSNRDPVVSYDERDVVRAVETLRDKGLTMMVTGAGSRVAKYKHTFARRLQFNDAEVAALCILMLRGPQTVGEIRGRTGRLHDFPDLPAVESTLQGLMSRGDGIYVMQLPRQPGRKESRYAHLLCGEPEIIEEEYEAKPEAARQAVLAENLGLQELREEVAALRAELTALRESFADFRRQFD